LIAGSKNCTLERCLNVFRDASNDSEQFAALLLVTKAIKAGEINSKARRRIFDAVGFTFPNRLLTSKDPPEGCPQHTFQALGLTLLACFCTDPDLARHPQMLNKIPIFSDVVSAKTRDASYSAMIDDAYQCLRAVLATPKGPRELINRGALSAVCQAYVNHSYGYDQALQLLVGATTDLMGVLSVLSAEFQKAEDMTKFQLCEVLARFVPPLLPPGSECLLPLYRGLASILTSKLSSSQRDPALKLSACLSQACSSAWIPAGSSGSKFFALLVNLACVEVRLTLEELDLSEVDKKRELMAACYILMELAIVECTREKGSLLQETQKVQLVGILEEALGAVIHYLRQVRKKLEDPFIFASVRILGAWLAEETSFLKQEICDLLPFLIYYAKVLFAGFWIERLIQNSLALNSLPGPCVSPSRFLLPGLSHLTAEDRPREILISEGAPVLLCQYFLHRWETFVSNTESQSASKVIEASLQTSCEIFLNFVVTAPDLISREDCFSVLMDTVLKSLSSLLPQREHLTLSANLATLGLMMARKLFAYPGLQGTPEAESFFGAAIRFLAEAYVAQSSTEGGIVTLGVSPTYKAAWPAIRDLWFLGMQAFASCVPLFLWLPQDVLRSGWLQDLLALLGRVIPSSVDMEVTRAYQGVLVELARASQPCLERIQQHRGLELASLYGMAALEQCLSEQ
uniref:Neurochondrin n=1 Tax=Naja naja TaxID=35670 RepID=A0A8C6X3J9_NAJNA